MSIGRMEDRLSRSQRLLRGIWPSRTLTIYGVKLFSLRFLVFLIGLVGTLLVLDLMGKSDNILAADGATSASIWRYASLKLPQFISQFAPFAILLSAVTGFAGLNQHSEIAVMKASGMSALQIMMPAITAAAIFALGLFVFTETVTTKARAELDYWVKNDYAVNLPPAEEARRAAWLEDGNLIIKAERVSRSGRVLLLDEVSLFERSATGSDLEVMSRARFATYVDGEWSFHDVRRFAPPTFELQQVNVETMELGIEPERFLALTVEPDHLSYPALAKAISELKEGGYATELLQASLYHKISGALACVLMPLIGGIAAFGLQRSGAMFVRIIIGMALGFSFFVVDNLLLALGEFGAIPALLASWAAILLFLSLGLSVIYHTEE
ncbi:MAG: LPS export ABC transporter permease LptG [Pseudomonadota bacterium]